MTSAKPRATCCAARGRVSPARATLASKPRTARSSGPQAKDQRAAAADHGDGRHRLRHRQGRLGRQPAHATPKRQCAASAYCRPDDDALNRPWPRCCQKSGPAAASVLPSSTSMDTIGTQGTSGPASSRTRAGPAPARNCRHVDGAADRAGVGRRVEGGADLVMQDRQIQRDQTGEGLRRLTHHPRRDPGRDTAGMAEDATACGMDQVGIAQGSPGAVRLQPGLARTEHRHRAHRRVIEQRLLHRTGGRDRARIGLATTGANAKPEL
jgi:hypothetical protein